MVETKDTQAGTPSGGTMRVLRNAFQNSSAWIITVIIGFLSTPYIVYKLGIQGYGIYTLFTGIVGYYGLLDLGLGQGVIKFVAEYAALNDHEGLCKSINAALVVQFLTGLCGSLLLVGFADSLLHLLRVSPEYWDAARTGLYVSSVGFFFTMITGTLSSALMGLQKYNITSKVNVLSNGVIVVFVVGLLAGGFGLRTVLCANAFVAFCTFVIYSIIVHRVIPSWKPSPAIGRGYFRRLFNFSGYMFVFKMSSIFNNQLLRFIISIILGPAAVTFYVVPMKVITAVGGFLNNISTVFFPFASELGAVKDNQKLEKVYVTGSKYIVSLSFPVYITLFFFSRNILTIWMGSEFAEKSWMIMSILAVSFLISSVTMIPANVTFGLGHSRVTAFFSILNLILNIGFVVPFSMWLGTVGVAVGVLVSQIESPIFIYYVTKHLMKISIHKFLQETVLLHVFSFILASIIFLIGKQIIVVDNRYAFLFAIAAIVPLYYYGCMRVGWLPSLNAARLLYRGKPRAT